MLQDVRGIGKKNEVKNVSDGYARNLLLPKGLAKIATEPEVRNLEIKRAGDAETLLKKKAELQAVVTTLQSKKLVFHVKAGSKGEVFGSVSEKDILSRLSKDGVEAKGAHIPRPLKTLGDHAVEVDFGLGIKAKIAVSLEPAS